MRLYQIRRKQDGHHFFGFMPHSQSGTYRQGEPMFCERPGVMYRRIDNVKINLQWICSPVRYKGWGRKTVGFKKFNPVFDHRKLNLYEVVIYDVDIQGKSVVKAQALFR